MRIRALSASLLLSFVLGVGGVESAHATYFVRPVLQYNGERQDNLSLNDRSSASATFNDGFTNLQSYVDLADGTIKTYLQVNGPNTGFAIVTGVMGDQIRYTGPADEAVSVRFDYDSYISADQQSTGTPEETDSRYIGIAAYFAVYEAGSGATYDNWTQFGTNSANALYVGYDGTTFNEEEDSFSTFYSGSLGTDLFLTPGRSYDIFSAFNLIADPGSFVGPITMDSLNTSRIGIDAPANSITSQSGTFLGFAQTPAAVPEPASWAMMIGGFGMVGVTLRRRRTVREGTARLQRL